MFLHLRINKDCDEFFLNTGLPWSFPIPNCPNCLFWSSSGSKTLEKMPVLGCSAGKAQKLHLNIRSLGWRKNEEFHFWLRWPRVNSHLDFPTNHGLRFSFKRCLSPCFLQIPQPSPRQVQDLLSHLWQSPREKNSLLPFPLSRMK